LKIKSLFLSLLAVPVLAASVFAGAPNPKLDSDLANRATRSSSSGHSRVIVTLAPGQTLPASFQSYAVTERLDSVSAQVLDLPDSQLASLSADGSVQYGRGDRNVYKQDFRTDISSGSFFANRGLGVTGKGVTVAVLDSGINAIHDDLRHQYVGFLDLVNHRVNPYDDNGHGTHVAGIIAGDGTDSNGKQAGAAPDAQIFSIKVLDANGQGKVSDVITAFELIGKNARAYNIRIVNVSFAAKVLESYDADPLTLAAKALVRKGIVVVAAAGNQGQKYGHEAFGYVGAPGNAPWVLTVGASSSMGTLTRGDDTVSSFSSRGPTAIDHQAKPDVIAGGVGIESASAPGSTDYTDPKKIQFLLRGSFPTSTFPYQVMTGTSMSAPAVAGTIALMLEANPRLTPNLAKAILEYTAQWNAQYNALEQGAGFVNALGAVRLATFYANAKQGDQVPVESIWSRHLNWGNHTVQGGVLLPGANAFKRSTTWGASTVTGANGDDENIIWGTDDDGNIIWGTSVDDDGNIIWGTDDDESNIIWGTADDENIIWGTDDDGNIIWGTDDDGNIIWGTDDESNIIWGTDDDDNIIWGTDDDAENIVWGTAADGEAFTPANPSYIWLLNRDHDAVWISHEFGDFFLSRGRSR